MRMEILPLDPRFSARKAKRGFESDQVLCDYRNQVLCDYQEEELTRWCSLRGTYFCLNICTHGKRAA